MRTHRKRVNADDFPPLREYLVISTNATHQTLLIQILNTQMAMEFRLYITIGMRG